MGIFNLFKRLFGGQPQPSPTRRSLPMDAPRKLSRTSGGDPLQELEKQIHGKGHLQYPFLDQVYSPNSRIPCVDFTPFIIQRLRAGDVPSISRLMRGIIEANPGLGTGGEWVYEEVDDVLRAPLEKYISFDDPDIYRELRAMWVVAKKEGGGREFWLANRFPEFCGRAFSPYEIELSAAIEELRKKGNRFIRGMRKDTPFWLDIPLFKGADLQITPLPAGEAVEKVRSLTVGARLHLFSAVEAGGGCLPRLTDYELRKFGLYIPDTSQEIIDSGLLSLSEDPELLKKTMSKNDLATACDKADVSYKKSWNKDKLLKALIESPSNLKALMAEAQVVCPNPVYAEALQALLTRAQHLEPVFRVLCFA